MAKSQNPGVKKHVASQKQAKKFNEKKFESAKKQVFKT